MLQLNVQIKSKLAQEYLSTDFLSKNQSCYNKWIQAVKKKDWVPNKYSYICSEHFEPSCFIVRPGKIGHHLNDNAVPQFSNISSLLPKN